MMGMTQSNCQGIGGILGRSRTQPQQGAYHVLHLTLLRPAVSGNRLFHQSRRIVVDLQIMVQSRNNRRTSSLAEFQRRSRVTVDVHIFNRSHLGSMEPDHPAQITENDQQSPGKIGLVGCPDCAAGDEPDVVPMGGDHPIACYP
jgi:hypothetical protein